MRVVILRGFSIDGPPAERFKAGQEVEHPLGLMFVEKGMAAAITDYPPPLHPPEPEAPASMSVVEGTSEMAWPELRRLASDKAGYQVRSRAEAEAVLARAPTEPDAA